MDLEEIKEFYREAPTPLLLDLTKNLEGLEPDVIPILPNELYKRNQEEAVALINTYLKGTNTFVNIEELKTEIHERLAYGEDLESIKLDIKERAGDYYQFLNKYINRDFLYDTSDPSQSQDYNEEILNEEESEGVTIEQRLLDLGIPRHLAKELKNKSKEEIDEQLEILVDKLRSRGDGNLVLGVLLLIAGITVTVYSSHIIYYGGILAGIGLIIKGIKLKSIKKPEINEY